MPRAKGAPSRRKKKKLAQLAKGFRGGRRTLHRPRKETVLRALAHAKRDRRYKKRDFRRLWIVRVNAAARGVGMTYATFMAGLRRAGVALDRRAISEIAIHDPQAFARLAEVARAA
jgi:large subunit ribosomal protein L20